MNFHKKEVAILKSEKDTLESVLTMKTQDVKKTLTNELLSDTLIGASSEE